MASKNSIGDTIIKNIEKNFKVNVNSLPSNSVNKKFEGNSFNNLNNLKPIRNKATSQNQKSFAKKPSKK